MSPAVASYAETCCTIAGVLAAYFIGAATIFSSYAFGGLLMAFFVSSSLLTRVQGDLKVCIRFVARRVFCQQPRRKHDTLLRMSFSHTLWLCARYISRFTMFDTALTQTATRRAHVATALLSPTLAFAGKARQQSQEGRTAELGASAVQRWHSHRAGAYLCLDCQMAACTLSARVRHRTWLAACNAANA